MEVTRLNRELDKRTSGVGGDANLGPMEANIKHLSKETEAKEKAIKELQRAWVGHQTELVALVNENTNVAEKTRRLKAEIAVATRRRSRLTENLARQKEEIKELDFAMERARGDAQRINACVGEKRSFEGGASHRRDGQREGNLRKFERDGERHRGVGEQNPERFGREEARVGGSHRMRAPDYAVGTQDSAGARTQAALDPDVGGDVVGAMKKEIARMTHRKAELARVQEALMRKVEQAVYKREAVAAKARLAKEKARDDAKAAKGKRRGASRAAEDTGATVSSAARGRAARKDATTKQGLKQACVELKREIKEVKAEISRRARRRLIWRNKKRWQTKRRRRRATPSPRYARARG